MYPFTIQKTFRAVAILLGLFLCAVLPASAAPTPAPSALPPAVPAAKAKPFPYTGVIASVDKTARTLSIGKNVVHKVYVQPETKLSQDEKPVAFETFAAGMDVRCSVRKRADGDYDAVSIKIGKKPAPAVSPAASPAKKP